MFDLGWSEMLVVLVIAIVVVGPKDLPKAIATISRYIRKARTMAKDFQTGMDQLAKDTEFEDIQKDIKKATAFDIKADLEKTLADIDPDEDDMKPEIVDEDVPDFSAPGSIEPKTEAPVETVEEQDGSEVKAS